GWNWVREVARFAEVHVVTRELNREFILNEVERTPLPNVEWVFVPTSARMRETNRLQYYLWQRQILPIARALHHEVGFDVAHHVTYGVHWLPSTLAKLGIPFIWGPVGGAEKAESHLAKSLPIRGRLEHATRQIIQQAFELDPLVRATAA